jgi:ABC-type glycerol-3-phosphate transport system permease component
MRISRLIARTWLEILSLAVFGVIFVVPFIFILLTAAKTQQEAALLKLFHRLKILISFRRFAAVPAGCRRSIFRRVRVRAGRMPAFQFVAAQPVNIYSPPSDF